MISSIEVENFKGFRHLKLEGLERFHVLVGANGSGKSTFLEVLEFVRDLLLYDINEAVSRRRAKSFRDLTWDRRGGVMVFTFSFDPLLFHGKQTLYQLQIQEYPEYGATIASEILRVGARQLVFRDHGGPVRYQREDNGQEDFFSFPAARSAISQVPPDEGRYPTANLVKKLFTSGVQTLGLNGGNIGLPCPSTASATKLLPTGNNLPKVACRLLRSGADEWLDHLRLALEDLETIDCRTQDDQTEYLLLRYRNGLEIPSWLASFGTLRTLALTLPSFLPADEPRFYLFEEPANGIHPKAIEIVVDAIKSIPNAQTFVTTHSPMIVQQVGIDSLLLFSKRGNEIVIEHGRDNKILHELDGVPDLATVFASRVLG